MIVIFNGKNKELPDETLLSELIAQEEEQLRYGARGLCVLNGILQADLNARLKDNDSVFYFRALEGG